MGPRGRIVVVLVMVPAGVAVIYLAAITAAEAMWRHAGVATVRPIACQEQIGVGRHVPLFHRLRS